MFAVKTIEVDVAKRGHITNSYIAYDTDLLEAVVIDPGYEPEKLIEKIKETNVKVRYILITHGHADHIGALQAIKEFTNADILISENDFDILFGKKQGYFEMLGVDRPSISNAIKLADGDSIKIGGYNLKVISTPGHTSGSLCFYEDTTNILFTGDTIFSNCYGRVDLDSGSFFDMKVSLNKLFEKFSNDTIIYPGHGNFATLGEAKKYVKLLIAVKGEKDESF